MRSRLLTALPAVAALLFFNACGQGGDPGVKRLYVEPGEKAGLPGDPFQGKGSDKGLSPVQEALSRGPVENNMIILEPEETLSLISQWSGISVESLLEDNRKVSDFGLVPGTAFVVKLTKSEFLAFQQLRDAHRIRRQVMRDKNVEIDHVIDYTVLKGETSASISAKFGAPLELFESMNPLAKNLALQPGQVVRVPIMKNSEMSGQEGVAGSKSVRDRVPGLPAPNPTPVPVPPQMDGKKLLVGPKPAED